MKTGDLDIIDFFHVRFTHLQCSCVRYVGRNATALSSAWSNILRAVTLCCHQQCHIFNEPSLNHLFAYNSRSVLIFYSLSGDFSSGVSPDVSGDDEDDDESGGYPVSHFTTQPLVM